MRIGDILLIIVIVLIVIILLPIILPLAIFVYIKGKVDDIRFKRFLVVNEGTTYFAYTDKQTSRKYVEDEILPFLPKDTRVLQLAGICSIRMVSDCSFLSSYCRLLRHNNRQDHREQKDKIDGDLCGPPLEQIISVEYLWRNDDVNFRKS